MSPTLSWLWRDLLGWTHERPVLNVAIIVLAVAAGVAPTLAGPAGTWPVLTSTLAACLLGGVGALSGRAALVATGSAALCATVFAGHNVGWSGELAALFMTVVLGALIPVGLLQVAHALPGRWQLRALVVPILAWWLASAWVSAVPLAQHAFSHPSGEAPAPAALWVGASLAVVALLRFVSEQRRPARCATCEQEHQQWETANTGSQTVLARVLLSSAVLLLPWAFVLDGSWPLYLVCIALVVLLRLTRSGLIPPMGSVLHAPTRHLGGVQAGVTWLLAAACGYAVSLILTATTWTTGAATIEWTVIATLAVALLFEVEVT